MSKSIGSLRPAWRFDLASDGAFFGGSALLFLAAAGMTIYWSITSMASPWMRMPGQSWLSAAASFLLMWTVMMLAMMLPSLAPMLVSFRRAARRLDTPHLDRLTVLAGIAYFFAWALFGVGAYLAGSAVTAAGMQWTTPAWLAPAVAGMVMLLAGGYQLTGWKQHQLMRCWDSEQDEQVNSRSAWRYGLRLGWRCILCCVGFMLVLLVTGVMELAIMTLIAAAITIERLAPKPEVIARLLGVVLITGGVFVIARTLGVA